MSKNIFTELSVLIIEDQLDARTMMHNMLAALGVNQIFQANNGREALTFIDSAFEMIDLIICDWNMPEMTGVELLRQFRSVEPDMPFLMVTGRADMGSVVEAKQSGVTGYIRKPFSQDELEAKIRIVMHRIALEKEQKTG